MDKAAKKRTSKKKCVEPRNTASNSGGRGDTYSGHSGCSCCNQNYSQSQDYQCGPSGLA